jgi:hypothetical protein
MRFRAHFSLGQLEISRDREINVVDSVNDVHVRIVWNQREHDDAEEMDEEEWAAAQLVGRGRLEIYLEEEPPKKARAHLVAAAGRLLPPDVNWTESLSVAFSADGSARPEYDSYLLPLDPYNHSMRTFLESLRDRAREHAKRIGVALTSICRARVHPTMTQMDIEHEGQWCSLPDRVLTTWTPAPRPLPSLDDVSSESLERALANDVTELLGHALLSEASKTYGRLKVVMAVTALEVHTKQFIAEVAPQTAWLLANIASPPTLKLLTDLLPTLSVPRPIGGKTLPPPPFIIEELRKGIAVRNDVLHRGTSVGFDIASRVLAAAEDVIWLLDHYRGVELAENHLRERTWTALMSDA